MHKYMAFFYLVVFQVTRGVIYKYSLAIRQNFMSGDFTKMLQRAAVYSTFCRMWRDLVGYIVIAKPMTDLCAQCHKNVHLIKKAVNMPEDLKTQVCTKYSI